MSSTSTHHHPMLAAYGPAAAAPVASTGNQNSAVLPLVETKPSALAATLAIDLGTSAGWARLEGGVVVASGTWLLASEADLSEQRKQGNERFFDTRFGRLLDFLEPKMDAELDRVTFEDVQFIIAHDAAQLWTSLRAAIWVIARRKGVRVYCVHTATLKRFATGNGKAQKADMARALAIADPALYELDEKTGSVRRDGIFIDHNEVDAIWVARFTAAVDRGEQMFSSVHERRTAKEVREPGQTRRC